MSLIKELLERVEKDRQGLGLKKNDNYSLARFLMNKRTILTFLLTVSLLISIFLFINPREATYRDSSSLIEAERRAIKTANEPLVDAPVLLEDVVEDIEPQRVPSLSLKGIIFDPEGASYAFINNNMLKEQDNIADVEILKIEQEKIKVMFKNNVYELALTED